MDLDDCVGTDLLEGELIGGDAFKADYVIVAGGADLEILDHIAAAAEIACRKHEGVGTEPAEQRIEPFAA